MSKRRRPDFDDVLADVRNNPGPEPVTVNLHSFAEVRVLLDGKGDATMQVLDGNATLNITGSVLRLWHLAEKMLTEGGRAFKQHALGLVERHAYRAASLEEAIDGLEAECERMEQILKVQAQIRKALERELARKQGATSVERLVHDTRARITAECPELFA